MPNEKWHPSSTTTYVVSDVNLHPAPQERERCFASTFAHGKCERAWPIILLEVNVGPSLDEGVDGTSLGHVGLQREGQCSLNRHERSRLPHALRWL